MALRGAVVTLLPSKDPVAENEVFKRSPGRSTCENPELLRERCSNFFSRNPPTPTSRLRAPGAGIALVPDLLKMVKGESETEVPTLLF
jgi:hypothetical protein